MGFGAANPKDVLQRNHDALVGRQIDASDASHVSYSLPQPAHQAQTGLIVGQGRFRSVSMSPEKATNVKSQRLPAIMAWQSLLNLRLDIWGLIMDFQRFRQPR
jgi:hypothetical protein